MERSPAPQATHRPRGSVPGILACLLLAAAASAALGAGGSAVHSKRGPTTKAERKALAGHSPAPRLTTPVKDTSTGGMIQKDASTGQIRRVQGPILVPGARTAREAAEGFLRARSKVLGLSAGLAELAPVREVASLTATHLTYAQVYGGLPV